MDAERFDALTRSLPIVGSRRRALVAALGGALGFLGLEPPGLSAAKKCKGLKGKKKKKCLKKAKAAGCRKDADCPLRRESCRGGRCQLVCPAGACPGCSFCFVRLEADGDRSRRCADSADVPSSTSGCETDADCPASAPLCLSGGDRTCTEGRCGVCVVSTGACDAPECQNNGDCPDQTDSCQGGSCQPVCPTGACAGCSFCFVTFASNGERVGVCANSLAASSGVIDCATDANCPTQDPTCVAVSAALCGQPPCRQCFSADVCTP